MLTGWPSGGYASFAIASDNSGSFLQRIRAYGATGHLLEADEIDTGPVCPPAEPDCIDG